MRKIFLMTGFLFLGAVCLTIYGQGFVAKPGNVLHTVNSNLNLKPIRVGVGVDNPTHLFHTNGNLRFQGLQIATPNHSRVLVTNVIGDVRWMSLDGLGGVDSDWEEVNSEQDVVTRHGIGSDGRDYGLGNVGIGVATPDPNSRLDIDGNIRVNSLWNNVVFSDASSGGRITMDGSNNQDLMTVGNSAGTLEFYRDNGGNVIDLFVTDMNNNRSISYSTGDNTINPHTVTNPVNFSSIISSGNALIEVGVNNSAIVGGSNHIVNAGANNSVILGGSGLTADQSNTAFAQELRFNSNINPVFLTDVNGDFFLGVNQFTPNDYTLDLDNGNYGKAWIYGDDAASSIGYGIPSSTFGELHVNISTTGRGNSNDPSFGGPSFDISMGKLGIVFISPSYNKSATSPAGLVNLNRDVIPSVISSRDASIDGTTIRNSVILGGTGLTATQSNFAYTQNLNISGLAGGQANCEVLSTNANGDVVLIDLSTCVSALAAESSNEEVQKLEERIAKLEAIIEHLGIDINEETDTYHNYSTANSTLEQNFPNPFSERTTIAYELGEGGYVTLEILGKDGKKLEVLVDENRSAGRYESEWVPRDLPSGMYTYVLRVDGVLMAKKALYLQ